MKTLKITRESDFSEVEVEFPNAMVELADQIAERHSDLPMIPTEDGEIKILVVDERVDRREREISGNGKYIITIKKY